MTSDDPNRTVHAQQAFELTEVFAYKFGHLFFGQARPRKLKLLEPDVSTAGGKRARQSLVLSPDEGDGGNLVIGFIDAPARIAELRSYNVLRQQFQARFNTEIDLKREEYDAMLRDLRSFLKIQRFDPKIVEAAPVPQITKKPALAPAADTLDLPQVNVGVMLAMLSIGILIGFAIGYIVFELL
jgi:hypothetical protein